MKSHMVTLPQIGIISATRAMAGAGIALLLADRMTTEQRRAVGWTLFAVGAGLTFPLIADLMTRPTAESDRGGRSGQSRRDEPVMAHG